jgi:hypothetical protein
VVVQPNEHQEIDAIEDRQQRGDDGRVHLEFLGEKMGETDAEDGAAEEDGQRQAPVGLDERTEALSLNVAAAGVDEDPTEEGRVPAASQERSW